MSDDDNFQKQKESKTSQQRTEEKYGEDAGNFSVNEDMKANGIVRDRKMTDCLFLIIFAAFLVCMAYLTGYSLKHGQVEKLIAPLDGDSHFCGQEAGYEDYPHLYMTDLSGSGAKAIFNTGVCVKVCPMENSEKIDCKPTSMVPNCDEQSIKDDFYNTRGVLGYCFPRSTDELPEEMRAGWKQALDAFLSNPTGQYFNDLYLSSRAIYISMAMGVVYCFLYIYFMSAFAEPIAWFCVVLLQVGLFAASVACWFIRAYEIDRIANLDGATEKQQTDSKTYQMLLLVGMVVFFILALIFLCCVICGRKSLALAIDTIDAAADFLAETKRLIFVPVLYFFLTIIWGSIWISAFACVVSMNEITADQSVIPQAKDLKWVDKKIEYMAWFMFFGFLWVNAWLKYSSNFVVMVSASTYYFNSSPNEEGQAEVGFAFKCAHVYHTGSIAVGAFIISIIQLIRFIFMQLSKRAAEASGDNAAVKIMIACGACILKCLEKVCDYINSACFAYMAVSGEGFCTSAWNGFLLNVKHMLKFTQANIIAKVFVFLGKVAIVVGNCFSLYFIMKNITKDTEEVSSLLGPMVVVGVVTYLTASIFLGLFDTAVMAMLTSLAVDMDMHAGEPHFGPPTFHDKCDKINHRQDKVEQANEIA